MVLDELAKKLDKEFILNKKFKAQIVQTQNFILAKPQTFMNSSGDAVIAICRFYKVDFKDLYIVHDDLDIQLGNYKIQFGKGPQIHNGLLSIEQKLGIDLFWNVRFGVENREVRGNSGIPGMVYSLQDFTDEENKIVSEIKGKIVAELEAVLS
jgi:PTH1 family peptidyl-tRNA hydrolase